MPTHIHPRSGEMHTPRTCATAELSHAALSRDFDNGVTLDDYTGPILLIHDAGSPTKIVELYENSDCTDPVAILP